MVKNPPDNTRNAVQSLDREDPLEEGKASHSSILAWEMDRGAWWATVHGVAKELDMTQQLKRQTPPVTADFKADNHLIRSAL